VEGGVYYVLHYDGMYLSYGETSPVEIFLMQNHGFLTDTTSVLPQSPVAHQNAKYGRSSNQQLNMPRNLAFPKRHIWILQNANSELKLRTGSQSEKPHLLAPSKAFIALVLWLPQKELFLGTKFPHFW
jgi:hypothetical protein